MKVFIAGTMQGSRRDAKIHNQSYRKELIKILTGFNTTLEVIDPDASDPDRLQYTNQQATEMFFGYNYLIKGVDLVIAYIPEASMGTAIEMWEAWRNKIPIITISQLKYNWVIKLLSTRIYPTSKEFVKAITEGELKEYFKE